MIELAKTRRSIRKYTSEKIDKRTLEQLLLFPMRCFIGTQVGR